MISQFSLSSSDKSSRNPLANPQSGLPSHIHPLNQNQNNETLGHFNFFKEMSIFTVGIHFFDLAH